MLDLVLKLKPTFKKFLRTKSSWTFVALQVNGKCYKRNDLKPVLSNVIAMLQSAYFNAFSHGLVLLRHVASYVPGVTIWPVKISAKF